MSGDERPATDEGVTGDPDWQSKQPSGDPIVKRIVDKLYRDNDDSPVAAPDTPVAYSPGIGDVLYAWQMQVDDGWNIIGMQLQNGSTLPLVMSSMHVAWEALEIAQAHANRHQCQVRLATFRFDTLAAVVEPNE